MSGCRADCAPGGRSAKMRRRGLALHQRWPASAVSPQLFASYQSIVQKVTRSFFSTGVPLQSFSGYCFIVTCLYMSVQSCFLLQAWLLTGIAASLRYQSAAGSIISMPDAVQGLDA